MSKHHVIYVPGLGKDYGQDKAIKIWRIYGLEPHYIRMNWSDNEDFDSKLKRILDKVNELKTEDNFVSLVGVSAGAGACLNAYAMTDKISSMVWVCGKINNYQTVRPAFYRQNPAFLQSMKRVSDSLNKLNPDKLNNIMSVHPVSDRSVPPNDTIVKGTKEKTILSFGHFRTIAYAITLRSRTICRFLLNHQN